MHFSLWGQGDGISNTAAVAAAVHMLSSFPRHGIVDDDDNDDCADDQRDWLQWHKQGATTRK